MGGSEQRYVKEAFDSNWLSTVGPNINAFEREFEEFVGLPAVALSSGTAAIHLALRLMGVGPGDEVFCQDLTFVATANPIRYLGAEPVFIDSSYESWNMDPELLADALRDRALRNRLPRAVIVVDSVWASARILNRCWTSVRGTTSHCWRIAAEALGGSYKNRLRGNVGRHWDLFLQWATRSSQPQEAACWCRPTGSGWTRPAPGRHKRGVRESLTSIRSLGTTTE